MLQLTISKIGWVVLVVFCAATIGHFDRAWAEPSLASKDRIDDLVVEVDGEKMSFTVINDARIQSQWFFIPREPQVVVNVNSKGEKVPNFFLLRYSHRDPNDTQKIVESGLLQFCTRLAPLPAAIEKMKAQLAKRVGIKQNQLLLSAIPFKSANVTLYDDGGKLIANGTHGAGLAPLHATQQSCFTVPLTRVGTSVMDALVNGQGGMHMAVTYEYEGWSTPLGFHCEANYEKAHSYYNKNKKFAAKASYWVFSGTASKDTTKIRETLEKEEIVKCEEWGKSGDALDGQVQTIMNNINANVVKDLTPPTDLSAAAVAAATTAEGKDEKKKKEGWLASALTGKFGAGADYSVKLVDMKTIRKGKVEIDLNKRNLEIRKSIVSGLIGIGSYPEKLRSELVQALNVEHGWPAAYFSLPVIGDDIGIKNVNLEVKLLGSKSPSQSARWEPATGWRNPKNAEKVRNVLAFSLIGIPESDKKKLHFTTDMAIARGANLVNVSMKTPVADANGDKFISSPLQAMKIVQVDGSNLAWRKIQAESNLLKAKVSLELSNGKKLRGTLKPRNINGVFTEPLPLIFLVHNEVTDMIPKISFVVNGKLDPVQSPRNGKKIDMKGVQGATEITLQDMELGVVEVQ